MVKPQNYVSLHKASKKKREITFFLSGSSVVTVAYNLTTVFMVLHLQNAAKISQHMQIFASGSSEIGSRTGLRLMN